MSRYVGALLPLVESIGLQRPEYGVLSGRPIKLPGRRLAWIGIDSGRLTHLLLPTEANAKFEFSRSRYFAGSIKPWQVDGGPQQRFLDLRLLLPQDKGTFLRFAEDVLNEVGTVPLDETPAAVSRCIERWLAFWRMRAPAFTAEWLRGLFAELHCLQELIKVGGVDAIQAWRGPWGWHHDFGAGKGAVEVKACTAEPPLLQINTLSQLDTTGLNQLLLLVVRLQEQPSGITLTQLVRTISQILPPGPELERFWQGLALAAYHPDKEAEYDTVRMKVQGAKIFTVGPSFPSITQAKFKRPLDRRIRTVRYSVELAGIKGVPLNSVTGQRALRGLLK